MAASSITVTRTFVEYGKGSSKRCEVVTCDCVGASANGTFDVVQMALSGFLVKVVTNPGATTMTANYDIDLQDPEDSALSATSTLLNNRHTTSTEQVYPLISGGAVPIFLAGTYGLAITNNAVVSGAVRIVFYLVDEV